VRVATTAAVADGAWHARHCCCRPCAKREALLGQWAQDRARVGRATVEREVGRWRVGCELGVERVWHACVVRKLRAPHRGHRAQMEVKVLLVALRNAYLGRGGDCGQRVSQFPVAPIFFPCPLALRRTLTHPKRTTGRLVMTPDSLIPTPLPHHASGASITPSVRIRTHHFTRRPSTWVLRFQPRYYLGFSRITLTRTLLWDYAYLSPRCLLFG
jgi:hypothetical protein